MSRSFLDTASRQSGRANLIHGTATVKFTYIAPQDHSQRTAELTFDSGEDPFYTLKAGDKIKILVARTDPEKIRIA